MPVRPHTYLYAFHERYLLSGARGSLCALLLLSGGTLAAQERESAKKVVVNNLPVPHEPNQLFYLQRDPDDNTVIYQLNIVDGVVDADKPVNVYWIRYAEGGVRKDLNFMQRTMAYGISTQALANGDFEIRLAAYKDHPLRLGYCQTDKTYKVYTAINNRESVLERIFVRIDGGSALSPNILYFELTGRDVTTRALVSERIKPDQ
ncbi:MAG TPA: DUF4833 domain-containing protein [Parapedobacter sp.]|nr:DUF4833 domain-containing protein [Parapedobacter sp.]